MTVGSDRDRADALLIDPRHDAASITDEVTAIVLDRHVPRGFGTALAVAFGLLVVFVLATSWLLAFGVGVWGVNVPVGWGFAIINFVWWIGIGHAGTLISAVLFLLRQKWRRSVNRIAETMTLFAVACAALFPLLHLGRPWLFYWMLPYPNTMAVWPQFRSPLVWDLFAVLTYGTVSLLFWYVGMVPDLATLRDRARGRAAQLVYGLLAFGWRGDLRHWARREQAYLLLAGLATPLVVSVHSIVSLDFAVGIVPGWHNTLFPPYFVAGAIFSGMAMVLTVVIPVRAGYRLGDLITTRHLDVMGKVTLATGLLVAYGYLMEWFTVWYGGSVYEIQELTARATGSYAPLWYVQMACNVLIPQALWSRRVRTNPLLLWLLAIAVNVGMWIERFMIVVAGLHRDYLPSSWGDYAPTAWDWALFLGTIGVFAAGLLLFLRYLPVLSMSETKELAKEVPGGD